MAVISVESHPTNQSGGQGAKWQRNYTQAWIVITDDWNDDPRVVLLSVPVAIGQTYAKGTSVDLGSYCQDIQVQCEEKLESGHKWNAVATYGPYDASQKPQNPLDQQPDVAWDFQVYQVPADVDTDGNPILNSAGDPFDPPVMKDFNRPILRVVRNEANYSPSLATAVSGSTNTNTFCGADPGNVKVNIIPGQRVFDPDIGYFWVVNYEFMFNPDGWKAKLLNQGMRQVDPSDATKQIAILQSGAPISTPALLDEDGAPLAVGADPVILEFKVSNELDFSIFNLDSFLSDIGF